MIQKPKLSVGDRVRVYDKTKFNWPVFGVVKEVSPRFIVEGTWGEEQFYPQQVRKLRPKQKPEKERVERWAVHCSAAGGSEWHYYAAKRFAHADTLAMSAVFHLVELKPGEVVLGREELARAWDEAFPLLGMEPQLEALSLALGLGKDKA